jgi:hypothetical protein
MHCCIAPDIVLHFSTFGAACFRSSASRLQILSCHASEIVLHCLKYNAALFQIKCCTSPEIPVKELHFFKHSTVQLPIYRSAACFRASAVLLQSCTVQIYCNSVSNLVLNSKYLVSYCLRSALLLCEVAQFQIYFAALTHIFFAALLQILCCIVPCSIWCYSQ